MLCHSFNKFRHSGDFENTAVQHPVVPSRATRILLTKRATNASGLSNSIGAYRYLFATRWSPMAHVDDLGQQISRKGHVLELTGSPVKRHNEIYREYPLVTSNWNWSKSNQSTLSYSPWMSWGPALWRPWWLCEYWWPAAARPHSWNKPAPPGQMGGYSNYEVRTWISVNIKNSCCFTKNEWNTQKKLSSGYSRHLLTFETHLEYVSTYSMRLKI